MNRPLYSMAEWNRNSEEEYMVWPYSTSVTYTTKSFSDSVLPILIPVLLVGGLLTLICLLVLLCRCCCCRSRGRVLVPPPLLNEEPPAPAPTTHHTYLITTNSAPPLLNEEPPAPAPTTHHTYLITTNPVPTLVGLSTAAPALPPTALPRPAAASGYELNPQDVNALVMAGFSSELQSTVTAAPSESPAPNLYPPTYEQAVGKPRGDIP